MKIVLSNSNKIRHVDTEVGRQLVAAGLAAEAKSTLDAKDLHEEVSVMDELKLQVLETKASLQHATDRYEAETEHYEIISKKFRERIEQLSYILAAVWDWRNKTRHDLNLS